MDNLRAEIEAVLIELAYCQDHQDNRGFSSHFTEDGVFDAMLRVCRGRMEIDAFFADRAVELGDIRGRGRHVISNLFVLDRRENWARAQHVQTVFAGVGRGPFPAVPALVLDVIDELVAVENRWLIARRDMAMAFGGIPQPAA